MGFMGFFKALFGICATKALADDLWSIDGDLAKVQVADVPQLEQKSGAVYLQGRGLAKPILVLRSEKDDYLAFTNNCTHLGRKIDPVVGEDKLRCCSVNHSIFDYNGNVVSGPAEGPLNKHEVTLDEEGVLIIKL